MNLVCSLLIAVLLYSSCRATFLAKSAVQTCVRGDASANNLKCQQKLVLTLALRGGQAGEQTYRTTVSSARLEDTGVDASILQSVDVQVQKTRVNIYYPLRYVSSVNNHPKEEVKAKIHVKGGFLGLGSWVDRCKDAPGTDDTTCGYAFNGTSGERIRDSQASTSAMPA
ncbi:uncharacterized protein LOC135806025 [Sycon ciliatum]|uniref:uncharacterized protein LOC135806025 n=1 Tax=Sycon ciliatum TaxID=27933 RepID=UPI0031F69FE8